MEFRILGSFEVLGSDGIVDLRGAKRRGLLACLVVHAGQAMSTDRLVEELWGDAGSDGAARTVQTYVSQMRKLLQGEAASLQTRPGGYALQVDHGDVDAYRFEQDVTAAGAEPDPTRRLEMLDAALALWRGPPLEEFAGAGWADREARRLAALHLRALRRRYDTLLDLDRAADAITELEMLVHAQPLDEKFWGQLMLALYRSGRQADALGAYQQARRQLVDDLGIEPGPALAGLERRILEHDPTLAAASGRQAVGEIPETRYARTDDGAHIAFQVLGDGPPDLVFVAEGASHLELAWDIPAYDRVFRRLASFSRLILFDTRGSGLSDPLGLSEQQSLEEQAKDMLAVLDAAHAERVAVVANSVSGLLAIFFAASFPNRISSLVLDGCYARLARAPDYPWGVPKEILEQGFPRWYQDVVAGHERGPGSVEHSLIYTAPSAMKDPEFVAQWHRLRRSTHGPAAQTKTAEMLVFSDVRPVLTAVQAPTLVLCRRGDRFAGKPHAVYLAEHISGAKLVELPGEDNLIYVGNSDADLYEIQEFLTGARHAPGTDRVLATVLFTDMVRSTEHASELGDRKWLYLLDAHDRTIRRQLERFRGREIHTAGDGFLATFDGPGRAIQCGCAIRDAVRALGIEIRAGLHTGEIEVRGDDVAGMAVHIGARVAQLAGAEEVLVSSTVKDLVAGSGIEFDDRGEHELKGVPGTWRLFSVVS